MYRLIIVALPLLIFFSQRLAGQVDSSEIKVFSGKIVDDSFDYTLPSVHIWNESTRMGSISNDSGEFSIELKNQDTIVFSAIGYFSYVVVSSSLNQTVVVRLKPRKYEIDEVIVRRFRSYESFKYQVIHLDLPEDKTTELRESLKITSTIAAVGADRERAVKDKMGTGGFGFTTALGNGIAREKIFKEKIREQKMRDQVIHAKFNRVLVGDITQLEDDELTEFIALCNFSNDYLYKADLYTIMEALYANFDDYKNTIDTIPSANKHQ